MWDVFIGSVIHDSLLQHSFPLISPRPSSRPTNYRRVTSSTRFLPRVAFWALFVTRNPPREGLRGSRFSIRLRDLVRTRPRSSSFGWNSNSKPLVDCQDSDLIQCISVVVSFLKKPSFLLNVYNNNNNNNNKEREIRITKANGCLFSFLEVFRYGNIN